MRGNRAKSSTLSVKKRRPIRRIGTVEYLESRALLSASPNVGILLLDHSGAGSLTSAGFGGVHVSGDGAIVIDSGNSKAGIDLGNGNVSASQIDVAGGLKTIGLGKFQGTVIKQAATADPLAGLSVPTATSPAHNPVNATGNTVLTLSPGTYSGGIHVSGNAKVTLLPGVYYLQGGGLWVLGNGNLSGTGVTIYNAPKTAADNILFSGTESVNLTAPNSGTYQNIVLFQNRSSTVPIVISGGNVNLVGKVYAAKSRLYFSGTKSLNIGGSAPLGVTGELIVSDVFTSSLGSLNIDATNNNVADLAISMTDGTATVARGSSTTYTITVVNNGPLPVVGATVSDIFPGTTMFTAVGTTGASGFNAKGNGDLSDTVNLAPGASITYTATTQVPLLDVESFEIPRR